MAKKALGFDYIMDQYREKYDIESIQNPNDLANLESMIRNQLSITKLQDQLDTLVDQIKIDPMAIKKVLDSIVALSTTNVQIERTLGIDRKTRKQEQEESVVDYILKIKTLARDTQ